MHDARSVHVIKGTGQLEGAGPDDRLSDQTKLVVVLADDPSQIPAGGKFQADFQFGVRVIPPQTPDDVRMIQFLYTIEQYKHYKQYGYLLVLDSKRNEECIGFASFLCVCVNNYFLPKMLLR